MKFKVMSDLHSEFKSDGKIDIESFPEDKETILLLAGDIGVGTKVASFIDALAERFKHVVYIPGNHEFYHGTVGITEHLIKDSIQSNNVTILLNESIGFGTVRIWGGTFWSLSEDKRDPHWKFFTKKMMSDYSVVKRVNSFTDKEVKFDPDCQAHYHKQAFKKLDRFLTKPWIGHTIVMTHHAPSERSSLNSYKGSHLQPCYFTPLDSYIEKKKIDLWVHGHMHNSSDYMIGNTRVVANPHGYEGYEVNPRFDHNKVISL